MPKATRWAQRRKRFNGEELHKEKGGPSIVLVLVKSTQIYLGEIQKPGMRGDSIGSQHCRALPSLPWPWHRKSAKPLLGSWLEATGQAAWVVWWTESAAGK